MSFVTDKEELKPGLIIFRRGDVEHQNWYCRVKLPKADRYKTIALKTPDINTAREKAFDQDADIRFRLKHDVPVFNRPFRDVAKEYLATQEARAKRGEISAARPNKLKAVIEGALEAYVGSTQVHLIGDEVWGKRVMVGKRDTMLRLGASVIGSKPPTPVGFGFILANAQPMIGEIADEVFRFGIAVRGEAAECTKGTCIVLSLERALGSPTGLIAHRCSPSVE